MVETLLLKLGNGLTSVPNKLPLILIALLHAGLINRKRWLSRHIRLYQVMMTLHFLNDVVNHFESTQKSIIQVIIASLKSETMDELINRIPGSRLLKSKIASEHDQEIPQSQTAE